MKIVPFLLCLLAGGLIMAGSVQAKATKNDGCHKVKSTGVGQDLGGGNTMATIGHFNATGPITGGTGKWAGTTGSLTFDGIENLTTGAFTETITGMTCGAEDDEDD
jgi:hypothetical protein